MTGVIGILIITRATFGICIRLIATDALCANARLSTCKLLMVEVVTLEGIRVEESWFPIQNVDGSVAGIVVKDRTFPIVLKGTTTPKQFSPVYVQQCNMGITFLGPYVCERGIVLLI
jgi:hypothetical protein